MEALDWFAMHLNILSAAFNEKMEQVKTGRIITRKDGQFLGHEKLRQNKEHP